jgi:hypothetical protein
MQNVIDEHGRAYKEVCSQGNSFIELCLGRVAFVPDKGLKTRVVAIGDGFTAAALQPIHTFLMDTLKTLPTSAVSNHGKPWEVISFRSNHKLFMGSSDATQFTDRFPIGPQLALLEALTSTIIVKL